MGLTDGLAEYLYSQLIEKFNCAIAIYKGSVKKFLETLAFSLGVDTTEPKYNKNGEVTGDRNLTVEELKESILDSAESDTFLILPCANRLPASVRFFLEDTMNNGANIVAIAPVNPSKDIFLHLLEVELELPEDKHIRKVMESEASALGLNLSTAQLAELQPLAGKNPLLARKVIRNEKLGLNKQNPQHTQYVVIMPIIVAILMAFGIVRFVGMGTGNKSLYIFGGATLVAGMTLKQLASIRGAKKRFG